MVGLPMVSAWSHPAGQLQLRRCPMRPTLQSPASPTLSCMSAPLVALTSRDTVVVGASEEGLGTCQAVHAYVVQAGELFIPNTQPARACTRNGRGRPGM